MSKYWKQLKNIAFDLVLGWLVICLLVLITALVIWAVRGLFIVEWNCY